MQSPSSNILVSSGLKARGRMGVQGVSSQGRLLGGGSLRGRGRSLEEPVRASRGCELGEDVFSFQSDLKDATYRRYCWQLGGFTAKMVTPGRV